MPKKQAKNAFFFFMLDYKLEEERRGRNFVNGLRDVSADPKCAEQWKNMAKQEKGYYEKRAKDAKFEERGLGKKTGTGESIDFLDAENKRIQEFDESMTEYIGSSINMAKQNNTLKAREFYLIHVNHFYVKEKEVNQVEYAPAEFAVVRFSLERGVQDVLHEIVYCKPQIGHTLAAKETSENIHRIPLETGEKNFSVMYNKLKHFLDYSSHQGEDPPPLYTTKKYTMVVQSLLDKMSEATGRDMSDHLVYSLERLYANLRNVCQENQIPEVWADYEISKDTFSYTPGLECEFHRNYDAFATNCSMSIVKRWVFTICDYCCENFGIQMLPGLHRPLDRTSSNLSSNLTASMSSLSVRSSRASSIVTGGSLLSMTGVSSDRRELVSARTAEEEKIRRETSAPVKIIEPGQTYPEESEPEVASVPVRTTKQPKSWAKIGAVDTAPDLDSEANFPSIGGRGFKRGGMSSKPMPSFGRGYGWPAGH